MSCIAEDPSACRQSVYARWSRPHCVRPTPAAGSSQTSDMHVVERLTRQGNTILYEVTVEDPECSWSRGYWRRALWCRMLIPARAFCRSEVTAKSTKTPLDPTKFGISAVGLAEPRDLE